MSRSPADDDDEATILVIDTATANAPAVPRKRGEAEMSVLKYKLNTLGQKTDFRDQLLASVKSDHTVLYEQSLSNLVMRGFTRTYLNRATGKLTALLNKPRMKSVDALHGEQAERQEDEFVQHARSRMVRHERERDILQARPNRVGWREKLAHAQVQRGIEERKAAEGRKRVTHEESEAARAAMKRRGRDSDGDEEDEERKEAAIQRHQALESQRGSAPSTPAPAAFVSPSTSDFFLASSAEADALMAQPKYAMNEQTQRLKDLLDTHHPTPLGASVKYGSTAPTVRPARNRFAAGSPMGAAGGAGGALGGGAGGDLRSPGGAIKPRHLSGLALNDHSEMAAMMASPIAGGAGGGGAQQEQKDSGLTVDLSSPVASRGGGGGGVPRSLRGSQSTPTLHSIAPTPGGYGGGTRHTRSLLVQRQRNAAEMARWKHANGLHPTDMLSSAAATLKMVPKLPVHQGLAAEDVHFTLQQVTPALFVDTHTALEIACAHVHFAHFRSRHKQAHYLLLSPDANYLCLVAFWWLFCTYFQSTTREPRNAEILHALLKNLGSKYAEYVRYLKIHLALRPAERLNSWYDQFAEGERKRREKKIQRDMAATNSTTTAAGGMTIDTNTSPTATGQASEASTARSTSTSNASANANATPGGDKDKARHQRSGSTNSRATSDLSYPTTTPPSRKSGGGGGGGDFSSDDDLVSSSFAALAFDPFTCVPSYPAELFNDAMEEALIPKTRSGIHHQKERFLFLLPFVLASACYELFYSFFPESSHFLNTTFRQRLEGDLHLVFNGVQLSEITLVHQRRKYMRESDQKAHQQTQTQTQTTNASTSRQNDAALLSPATGTTGAVGVVGGASSSSVDAPLEKPTFESLFAFNSSNNATATRAGQRFHAALLNPNHSSVAGSPWITASAKRLASGITAAPTPLTRHTRIGGVREQPVREDGDGELEYDQTIIQSPTAGDDAPTSPNGAGGFDSPKRQLNFSGLPGPPPSSSLADHTTSAPHTVAHALVLTSERAFSFGQGSAAAAAKLVEERMRAFSGGSPTPGGAGAGAGSAGAAHMMMATPMKSTHHHANAPGSAGSLTGGSPGTGVDAHGDPLTAAAAKEARDEKLRRRAREKPVMGSLHSTGDWSRDERERRDFLTRMKTRHEALEKEAAREWRRSELARQRVQEGSEEAAGGARRPAEDHSPASEGGGGGGSTVHAGGSLNNVPEEDAADRYERADEYDDNYDDDGDGLGLGMGDDAGDDEPYDPISFAFRSVLGKKMADVPTSVVQRKSGGPKKKADPMQVKRGSASTPGGHALLLSPSPSQQQLDHIHASPPTNLSRSTSAPSLGVGVGLTGRLDFGATPRKDGFHSPTTSAAAAAGSSSMSNLARQRPSSLSIPAGGPGPHGPSTGSTIHGGGLATSSSTGDLLGGKRSSAHKRERTRVLDQYAPQEVTLDAEAADGFTASDLVLPLQSMLLTEENLRHAQQLRPPQVRLNLNALTLATSVSLGMRSATSAWGSGIVLKHTNPIPAQQLGVDLADGFAYVPKKSALQMNSIGYMQDKEAQESQLRLLSAYKSLHTLQLQEQSLKPTPHATPAKAALAAASSSLTPASSSSSSMRQEIIVTQPESMLSTSFATTPMSPIQEIPTNAAAGGGGGGVTSTPAESSRTLTFLTPSKEFHSHPHPHHHPSAGASASSSALPGPSPATTNRSTRTVASSASTPSLTGSSATASGGSGVRPRKARFVSSLHKPSKLEALLAESKQVHWTSAPDDPNTFLTPRTRAILQQVEGNAEAHEKERAAKAAAGLEL